MHCPGCKKLSDKLEKLDELISTHDDPLLLLHSFVSIMRPKRAAEADSILEENNPQRSQTSETL